MIAGLALGAGMAHAASVSPVSYDMLDGGTGSYQYWDDTYPGNNNTVSYDSLTGGTGDLTDGVIATDNWFITEAPAGPGPYVGWSNYNPVITFNFATAYDFLSATFHFDDSDGNGGVSQPRSVNINGTDYTVPTNDGSAPFAFTADLAGLTTDTLVVTITRSNSWVFLSEVEFDARIDNQVPLPASVWLLAAGLGGLGLTRARRKV
ncbi:hypothetical protein RGUI_2102 [Rhodovulum sp. P5]|uniref:VPLPA-CTERM sorting domain-containing protein n=1 Tax=Rhodovulum sp. P5 TaxID=1564506 RepID=UPI0009C32097|nr:VPLPA-CTERM sorting domain-containing protein [Rhodovulum sp. P5]ARE40243.1 hypothetical protein RGUI_2102 [Rhodovulum sp. P5]